MGLGGISGTHKNHIGMLGMHGLVEAIQWRNVDNSWLLCPDLI
jgi:hypothetical protein